MRTIAKTISALYHPLLILLYGLLLLLLVNPYLFGVHSILERDKLILTVFFSTVLLPLVGIWVMGRLDLISSFELPRRTDRYGPLITAGIFYGWLLINLWHNPEIPIAFTTFVLGTVIALITAFLINLFYKLSLHGIGVGGLITMAFIIWADYAWGSTFPVHLQGDTYDIHTGVILGGVVLLAGITGSCRLYLNTHKPHELLTGFLVGMAALFIAYWWLNF